MQIGFPVLALALSLLLATCRTAASADSPAYDAYFNGRYHTALKLAEQESAKGSKEAYTLIGEIYARGLGVAPDFSKAADAYAKAADLGDPNAAFALGSLVAAGRGVKKNPRLAADLFEKAAKANFPEAEYNLALIYLSGDGRPQDLDKAVSWLQKAAADGNAQAQYDLGAFYQFGRGVPLDKTKAALWIGKAAEAGLAAAQIEYGIILFRGEGVPADEVRGADYIRRAAEQGNPIGEDRLARLYATGTIFQQDLIKAAKWHLLARAKGAKDPELDNMLAGLTPEQRAQAEREARAVRSGGFDAKALAGATFRAGDDSTAPAEPVSVP